MAEDPTKVNSGGDATTNLYKLSSSGVVTLLKQDVFPDVSTNTFTASDFTVDERQGKIYFLEPDRGGGQDKRYRKYDIESNEFEGYITVSGLPSGATPINMGVIQKLNDTVEKKCESTDNDCDDTDDTKFVSLGGSGTDELIRVDSDGISTGGSSSKSLVKYVGNELHIGENSWITKEEDGRQKVYAKDAAGNAIPIDYTNGTKLLINGRDVEQVVDNVDVLSAALMDCLQFLKIHLLHTELGLEFIVVAMHSLEDVQAKSIKDYLLMLRHHLFLPIRSTKVLIIHGQVVLVLSSSLARSLSQL
tara:strand:- start:103 stop:1014 length:912 start_codon:yes stop_codon:yes gene_type:complete